jgi:hypothetical protein
VKERIKPTLVQEAIQTINGFERVFNQLQQQLTLSSTMAKYIRQITQISLNLKGCPNIDEKK